jgi:hypothetical protein
MKLPHLLILIISSRSIFSGPTQAPDLAADRFILRQLLGVGLVCLQFSAVVLFSAEMEREGRFQTYLQRDPGSWTGGILVQRPFLKLSGLCGV